MKGLLITSLILFIVSFVFRLVHWPGASVIALFSVLLVFVFAVFNSFSQKKVFQINILGGWVLFSWVLYILFKYMYWHAGPSFLGFNTMFLVVSLITSIYIIQTTSTKVKNLSKTVLAVCAIGFVFSFIPAHVQCYFFDLNKVINKENNKTNFYAWDKYSWFLYIKGEKERALQANQKALDALKKCESDYPFMTSQNPNALYILQDHQVRIENGTWAESYLRYPYR